MKTHQEIDNRSLRLAKAIVKKIDADPLKKGVQIAKDNCKRWYQQNPTETIQEWQYLLELPWNEIKSILLDESEEGKRLRQNNPFCGILMPQERWKIYYETT